MATALSPSLQRWFRRGALARVRGLDVFYVREGVGRGTPLLLLHGFPTSGYDWSAALPALTERHEVLLLDLPGFGLSAKPALHDYSLVEQGAVVLELARQLGLREAHLVAHDMGTTVACELLHRRALGELPFALRSLTLMNGSVYQEMAHLTPSQRLLQRPLLGRFYARLANETVFRAQFRSLLGRRDALPDDELARLWELMQRNDGLARMPQLAGYMRERGERAVRWHAPLRALDVPALVLWGRRDPVAVFAIAERLAEEVPTAKLIELPELGHFPMLEDPARVSDAVLGFVASCEPSPRRSVLPPSA